MSNIYKPDIVARNFPELFREEFPNLIKFVSDYYKYLETTGINDIQRKFDIDAIKVKKFVFNTKDGTGGEVEQVLKAREEITAEFDILIDHFLSQLAPDIPALFTRSIDGVSMFPAFAVDSTHMRLVDNQTGDIGVLDNPRAKFGRERIVNFLRNTSAIYTTRGTEEGLTFLFRFIYNELATVEYPKEKILRASESTWIRKRILTIDSPVQIESGDTLTWFMTFNSGDKTPTYTAIVHQAVPIIGAYPQNSQVKRYQVTVVYDPRVEIDGDFIKPESLKLHKSSGHTFDTLVLKKMLSRLDIVVDSTNAEWANGQTISIKSAISGGEDTILYVSSVQPFPGDDRLNSQVLNFTIIDIGSGDIGTPPMTGYMLIKPPNATTIRRTKVKPIYSWEYVDSGKFRDSTGMTSDTNSNLQDNFLYQEFSYMIESNVTLRDALATIKFNHPAGIQYFYKKTMNNIIDFHIDGSSGVDLGNIYLFDELWKISEHYYMNVIARLFDTITVSDDLLAMNVTAVLSDSYNTGNINVDDVTLDSYFIDGYINEYFIKYLKISSTSI